MKSAIRFVGVVGVLAIGLASAGLAAAGNSDRPADPRKECREQCRDQHRTWVDLCIDNHDPHRVTPSARGQCVEAGSERLQSCLKACGSAAR